MHFQNVFHTFLFSVVCHFCIQGDKEPYLLLGGLRETTKAIFKVCLGFVLVNSVVFLFRFSNIGNARSLLFVFGN